MSELAQWIEERWGKGETRPLPPTKHRVWFLGDDPWGPPAREIHSQPDRGEDE